MAFRPETPFYRIPDHQLEATFGAVVEILLKTRLKLHLEAHPKSNDEDVNAYLAGVLVSYIDPEYLQAISHVLSQYDIDVFQAAHESEDHYRAYWIYKVNADDLLVSTGIFQRISGKMWEGQMNRIKQYYTFASEYQRRMYRKSTAVGEVQIKLAESTQRYLHILAGAREEYLHMMQSSVSAKLMGELEIKSKQDELLDAYSAWLKGARDRQARQHLMKLIHELQAMDAVFDPKALLSALGEA